MNFTGETGPYMQYTYVRTQSILRNANSEILSEIDYSKLLDDEAIEVVKTLKAFPDVIVLAADKNEPSLISRHLIDLAKSFSRFYNEHHIICDDKDTQNARLALTKAVGFAIKNGLALLGIETPEKM